MVKAPEKFVFFLKQMPFPETRCTWRQKSMRLEMSCKQSSLNPAFALNESLPVRSTCQAKYANNTFCKQMAKTWQDVNNWNCTVSNILKYVHLYVCMYFLSNDEFGASVECWQTWNRWCVDTLSRSVFRTSDTASFTCAAGLIAYLYEKNYSCHSSLARPGSD